MPALRLGEDEPEEEELAEVSPAEMDSIPIPAKCRIHLPLVHYS